MNITGLRRAFAYAFNKTNLVSDIGEGFAIEHDSVIPIKDELCIESELPYRYYSNQSDVGNQILDNLGFTIDGGTGFRLAPDGSPFHIDILYWYSHAKSITVVENAVDALDSLHIDSDPIGQDFHDLFDNVDLHGSYDMVVSAFYPYMRDLDWILKNYHSSTTTTPYMNPSNYENDTFDALCETALSADTYEDLFDVASDIQKHLHENVPVLILCQDIEHQAYRTSDFTGHIEDEWWGVPGPWTNLKVHQSAGSVFGGVFDVGIWSFPNSFNLFTAWQKGSYAKEKAILNNLYSSLYKRGPDGELYPDLAENVLIETHDTNSMIPEGQIRVTCDIRDDAVWSDGTPLDAEDVAFTFTYIIESMSDGNPIGYSYGWGDDFIAALAPPGNEVTIMLNGTSYYHAQQILEVKIIPKHIFNDIDGIGYDGWDEWNPIINPSDPHVTCGPFYVSAHNSTAIELARNMDYHWLSGNAPSVISAEDVSYVSGSTGNQIVWEVSDEDPDEYTVYRDGVLQTTETWDGSDIAYGVDGLAVGTYNFTIVLTDTSGWTTVDTVIVTVTAGIGGLPDLLTIGIVGGVAVILIIGVVLYKKK